MELSRVIIKPLASEKNNHFREYFNRIVLKVHPDANKIEIKQAVEDYLSTKVLKVTVVRKRPRPLKRQGRIVGKIAGYKKAYVTVASADDLTEFEGV